MATRKSNERRFPQWDVLPDAGRRYYRIVIGKKAGYARYIKIVDSEEITISIVQEVFDDNGRLIGVHQKYPVDTGHQGLESES